MQSKLLCVGDDTLKTNKVTVIYVFDKQKGTLFVIGCDRRFTIYPCKQKKHMISGSQ